MAKYEVRIKGSVRIRVNNNSIRSIRVDEITEANDLTYVNHLRSREGCDHWARAKYGNVVDWQLHVSYKVIKEEQQKMNKTKTKKSSEPKGDSLTMKVVKFVGKQIWKQITK